MNRKTRKKLFITFVLIFLMITPCIVLYATGYKIKLTWPIKFNQTFQKTGMFILNTNPRGAKIYLNQKPQEKFWKKYFSREESCIQTPAKIKNLLPGEYVVNLELDGYWPWQKKLFINPGQSTYAEDIHLFKKEIPLQILQSEVNFLNFSPDKKYALAGLTEEIIIINLKNELEIKKIKSAKSPKSYHWSADSKKIIINNKIIDLKNINQTLDLGKIIGVNIKNIKWDPDNSNRVYYQDKELINYFDLDNKISKSVTTKEKHLDYIVKNDHVFVISQINTSIKLKGFALKDGKMTMNIDIPYSSEYRLVNENHELINLYDQKHGILYLINPFSVVNPLKEIVSNIKYMEWVDDGKLLYANDFEIWFFDLVNRKKTILTRISQPIKGIAWHPSENYIIYASENSIKTIELDQREKRNITELICLNEISSIFSGSDGNILYFAAAIGTQKGLYKLSIH